MKGSLLSINKGGWAINSVFKRHQERSVSNTEWIARPWFFYAINRSFPWAFSCSLFLSVRAREPKPKEPIDEWRKRTTAFMSPTPSTFFNRPVFFIERPKGKRGRLKNVLLGVGDRRLVFQRSLSNGFIELPSLLSSFFLREGMTGSSSR